MSEDHLAKPAIPFRAPMLLQAMNLMQRHVETAGAEFADLERKYEELKQQTARLIPYAVRRLQVMHAAAYDTHGDHNLHRCACYRHASRRLYEAAAAIGDEDADGMGNWLHQLDQAALADPGGAVGTCSVSGKDCPHRLAADLPS